MQFFHTADGFAEIAIKGETTVMCDVGDSESFAKAVINIYNDKEYAKKLGDAGREQFLENYSATAFASALTDVYKKLTK